MKDCNVHTKIILWQIAKKIKKWLNIKYNKF